MNTEAYSKTLKVLYFRILTRVADTMTNDDKLKFEFWCGKDLPRNVLETNEPLKWFGELDRRGKIAPENLVYIEDFLKHAGLKALFEDLKHYQARQKRMSKSLKTELDVEKILTESDGVEEQDANRLSREIRTLVRGIQIDKNRNPGMLFVLYGQGIDALLETSTLRRTERKSVSRKIKILALQLFGHYVCSPERNLVPSLSCGECSDSQCSLHRTSRKNMEGLSTSIENLNQKMAYKTRVIVSVSVATLVVSVCGAVVLPLMRIRCQK